MSKIRLSEPRNGKPGHDDINRRTAPNAAEDSGDSRFRALIESADVLVAQLDQQGCILYVNQMAEKIFGIPADACIGRPATDFIHPDDAGNARRLFRNWRRKRVSNTGMENRVVNTQTGKAHHMLWSNSLHFTSGGRLTLVNCFARDLTERKRAEEALRSARDELERRVAIRTAELVKINEQLKQEIEDRRRMEQALRDSEERYRALFENNPIGTIIVDHEARVTGYNIAKSEAEDRLPRIGDVMYVDFAARHARDMHTELLNCIRTGSSKEFPELNYGGRFLYVRISPFKGGAIISSIDITDRKQVEAALRESEKRYRNLVEAIPHGIQEVDTDGTITFANAALSRIFGYAEGELIGKPLFDLIASDDDRDERHRFFKHLLLNQPSPAPYLNRCLTKGGRTIDIQADWDYKRDRDGRIIGFIATITDISQRRAAEEEKHRLEAQLRHAQKMEAIGTLAGGIAHDFNNILGAILLNTELAIDDLDETGDARYALEQVLIGSHRARELVEQILTFSREAEVERRPLKIDSVVKETLKMLRAMLPATILIENDIAPEIDPILADPTQIQQLVMNLCNNSAQAMETGGKLSVSLQTVTLEEPPAGTELLPGRYVRLTIRDSGCGIREDIRGRIFDPFFTTKRPGEGTGLGLSVVHGIVSNHQGAITFQSKTNRGTRFDVFLPAIPSTTLDAGEEGHSAVPAGNERILFVDDEEVVADANKRLLMRLGYQVTTAADGREALKIFRNARPGFDIVITDMTMPMMTGTELAAELTRINPSIPVILCTGYNQFLTPERAGALGIKAFVLKPFARNEIAETIRNVLDNARPEGDPS